ncbi:hypothetical protein MLD38_011683 [Melastoma candidum]|uniref:Uncharacterized protein n=1 Tax=Melastoma candidum TaxID=119954 RepID=A0ACB9R3W2_9MYRT|nr:hypothetical protein MLD38_011683 [Melastoma candidum]
MQPSLFPFLTALRNPFLFGGDDDGASEFLNPRVGLAGGGLDSSRVFLLFPLLLFQGEGMDLSRVGEKILSSVKSATSLGLIPSSPAPDRPEVPARAAAAALIARALAGLPPHQRFSLPSSSSELNSIYGSRPAGDPALDLEEEFYEEEFDPVRHIIEHAPSEGSELSYFEEQATLRLGQLDRVAELISRQVTEHHKVMVKGMSLVRELEKDLKVANVISMNGRRHLTSSMNEVSQDLIVNSISKKKQALLDLLPVLRELLHARDMHMTLESLVEEGNYCRAFQVLSEYLQLLDGYSELSAIKELSRGVEVWLGHTLQKLDSLLLGVCKQFKPESYVTVIDAYALIGDVSGLVEKIQSFFMQEVISETHRVLRNVVLEDSEVDKQNNRFTYSDLCHQIPEPKFRECLLRTLAVSFKLMCSFYEIMSFRLENEVSELQSSSSIGTKGQIATSVTVNGDLSTSISHTDAVSLEVVDDPLITVRNESGAASSSGSPWYQLRQDATTFVSQNLQRGRKNFWQLTTSRVSVLLSSAAVTSMSIHQFLRNYEDLNIFILSGEAFCGSEASDFRNKLKAVCENYLSAFHRQNIYAFKMVLERENWLKLPQDAAQVITFTGLLGDGAALIGPSGNRIGGLHPVKSKAPAKSGFSHWHLNGNIFSQKLASTCSPRGDQYGNQPNGLCSEDNRVIDNHNDYKLSPITPDKATNGHSASEEESEDLLADFIDEDSQLPSRISKHNLSRNGSKLNEEESTSQTGSSLCLLRSMDKYARLMQKLEIVNVEFFKGICQLFEIFFHFVFQTFCQHTANLSGKGINDTPNHRLKTALSRIAQDCDQWIKPHTVSLSSSPPASFNDVTPTGPNMSVLSAASLGLKERCAGADTIQLVARILHKSKAHLQSMLLLSNATLVDDFYVHLVDSVPDLTELIHRITARLLLHINGYVDRIANAKWEVKELGLEHNGYVDLLLGEVKHYKTRLLHGGINREVQDILMEYGLDIVAETLVEGLSRVKRCTDEGRALMSLDLQVLINGLQHFVPSNVRPKLQIVETFIKAYYLPETEYVHWARAHPEYTKNQIVGLVNLVATMKSWKRKTRLEILEKIE